jgi:hypothetical protein
VGDGGGNGTGVGDGGGKSTGVGDRGGERTVVGDRGGGGWSSLHRTPRTTTVAIVPPPSSTNSSVGKARANAVPEFVGCSGGKRAATRGDIPVNVYVYVPP